MAESSWQKKELLSPFITFTRLACLPHIFPPDLGVNSNQCWQCFIYLFWRGQTPSLVSVNHQLKGRDLKHFFQICLSDSITCKWVFGGKRHDERVELKSVGKTKCFFFWFCSGSEVMCSRIILVRRAVYRNTASLFLIETSGVWELTEWSLSHHCLSPSHYREALWPLFSPIIHAKAPSPALWLGHSYPIISKSLPSDGTSKAASTLPNIPPGFIYDLWAIDTVTRVFFVHPCLWCAHAPEVGWQTKSSVALWEHRQSAPCQQAYSDPNGPTLC